VKPITFFPGNATFDTIFRQTKLTVEVFGWPKGGYSINLIQLIILLVLALVVVFVTERLTKGKVGGLAIGVILTIIGAYIIQAVTVGIPDILVENIRIISSLVGAIIIGVFYILIRARFSSGKEK
jgi:hypothetical protein